MIALAWHAAWAAPVAVDPSVDLRAIGSVVEPFAVDADGTTLAWGPAIDTRIRLGLGLAQDPVRVGLGLDVMTGQLLGATWNLGAIDERGRAANDALTLAGVVPRHAFVGARLPWLDVQAGLDTSQWGLGMLANDGASDPLFGRTDFGDRVVRLRLATQPAGEATPLYVILAGDRVVADESARWSDGDVAWQVVGALLYRKPGASKGACTGSSATSGPPIAGTPRSGWQTGTGGWRQRSEGSTPPSPRRGRGSPARPTAPGRTLRRTGWRSTAAAWRFARGSARTSGRSTCAGRTPLATRRRTTTT
ncbi:MAG: hypothetical protein ABMB14_12585 [Myxococcota bacterium]